MEHGDAEHGEHPDVLRDGRVVPLCAAVANSEQRGHELGRDGRCERERLHHVQEHRDGNEGRNPRVAEGHEPLGFIHPMPIERFNDIRHDSESEQRNAFRHEL